MNQVSEEISDEAYEFSARGDCFSPIASDDYTLSRGETVRLDDNRRVCIAKVSRLQDIDRFRRRLRRNILRGRYAVSGHEVFCECFARFESGGRHRRTDYPQTSSFEFVDDTES